jgi:hypothetical protein
MIMPRTPATALAAALKVLLDQMFMAPVSVSLFLLTVKVT